MSSNQSEIDKDDTCCFSSPILCLNNEVNVYVRNTQMTTPIDRQGILDNLTAIETTAKLLVNAFVKKNNDRELALNGIHREELINQTTTFLSQSQKLILNLANTFNLSTEGFFDGKKLPNESAISSDDDGIDWKSSPSKRTYSLSSVTLDDIIENRLTPKHLLSTYPLLHDPIQPNLVALARNIRQIENFDDLILKIYSKIFNHEERICCNYEGIHGKLPYPRHKRQLFDLMLTLAAIERNKILDLHERNHFYIQCEKHFSHETSLTKPRGLNLDQINQLTDEEQFICALFRLVISQEEIKNIFSAKQESNDNEMCIYYARPIHLLWIKQKWLERYPGNESNEAQRWSQCIEAFLETAKIRPTKRKTMDGSTDHKRPKTSLTLEEKTKQIDRTKFNVLEYATQLLHLISKENKKNLPSLEQLQLIEQLLFRYYWTINPDQTWSQVLDLISQVFENDSFRQSYYKNLVEIHPNDQIEIERLFQIIATE